MRASSTLTYTMPARLDALPALRAELRAWLAQTHVDPETAADVVLAAWEVCANAVEHPIDRRHPDVTLVAKADRSGVCVVVEDSGTWHDRTPRPGRGFGLRLARAMVDRMSIARRGPGTKIVLWRSNGSHA